MRNQIILTFFFCLNYSFGQDKYFEFPSHEVKSNILKYRIYYLSKEVKDECRFNSYCLLPKKGWTLDLNIKKIETDLFSQEFEIYEIDNKGYTFKKVGDSTTIIDSSGCGTVPYSSTFLVGLKKGRVISISGMFFKDPIADYFDLKPSNPRTFYKFLKVKLHNYRFDRFSFRRKKTNRLIFDAHYKGIKKPTMIQVDIDNFDKIKVDR